MRRTLLDIDLKLLNVFKTIVDCQGLTPAANHLNVSVSSVSNQLTDLEYRLGMTLCRRGRTGFELTDEGRQVFAAHKILLDDLSSFSVKIGEISGSLVGNVRMSMISAAVGVSTLPLAEAIGAFKARSRLTTLSVEIQPVRVIEQQLLDETTDIGISVHQRKIPELNEEILTTETLGLFCGDGHPLFSRELGSGDEELVLKHERCFRDYIRYAGGLRRKKTVVHTANSNELEGIALLVLSGKFLGHLPVEYASKWVRQEKMRQILPNRFKYKNSIVMLTKAERNQSRVVQAMVEDIRTSLSRFSNA